MLQNLLFSVNMSLPLFVLLGLGCFLTHKGMFSDDYIARTTNLVYYVMLPAKLFLDISHVDLGVAFEGMPLDKPLVPAVIMYNCGDTVEFV